MSVSHLWRRQASEVFASPRSADATLVDDSLTIRCVPKGVAKNTKTTSPPDHIGDKFDAKGAGVQRPESHHHGEHGYQAVNAEGCDDGGCEEGHEKRVRSTSPIVELVPP